MIVLGLSGFENKKGHSARTPHRYWDRGAGTGASGRTHHGAIPLQFFPLHLIGHDCAASLLIDGQLVAAASEERFTRIKHGFNLAGQTTLPRRAIDFCLREAGLSWDEVDYVAHYCRFTEESIRRRFENISRGLTPRSSEALEAEYASAYRNRLSKPILIEQLEGIAGRPIDPEQLLTVDHHTAHAAGAFFSSPFHEALVCTVDGYGEEDSSVCALGSGTALSVCHRVPLPTSLGVLYQLITVYLGFSAFGDEYKVMGLSSYGDSSAFAAAFDDLIRLESDGSYSMPHLAKADLELRFREMFGEIRWHDGVSQKAADIAASLQRSLEKTLLHYLSKRQEEHSARNLCMSGGVALNAAANGVLTKSGLFERVYFQPASADDGASLGAALYAHNVHLGQRRNNPISHVYWGPASESQHVEAALRNRVGLRWEIVPCIEASVAELLAAGNIVGWFQGRMEMGPRALGARSILCDPRDASARDRLNLKIKNREAFRPFAPSVLKEHASHFFEMKASYYDPFMTTVTTAREERRNTIPAVVHVDGTSRLQIVSAEDNPRYHRLIHRFYELTQIPLVLNTSFNQAGEPIVCSAEHAVDCLIRSNLDALAIEDYLVFSDTKASTGL